jgi:hypothetical protein
MEWRASRCGPHFPVRCGFDLAVLRWGIWILRRSSVKIRGEEPMIALEHSRANTGGRDQKRGRCNPED